MNIDISTLDADTSTKLPLNNLERKQRPVSGLLRYCFKRGEASEDRQVWNNRQLLHCSFSKYRGQQENDRAGGDFPIRRMWVPSAILWSGLRVKVLTNADLLRIFHLQLSLKCRVTSLVFDFPSFYCSRKLLKWSWTRVERLVWEKRIKCFASQKLEISKLRNLKRRKQTRLETLLPPIHATIKPRIFIVALIFSPPPPIEWTWRMIERFCSL